MTGVEISLISLVQKHKWPLSVPLSTLRLLNIQFSCRQATFRCDLSSREVRFLPLKCSACGSGLWVDGKIRGCVFIIIRERDWVDDGRMKGDSNCNVKRLISTQSEMSLEYGNWLISRNTERSSLLKTKLHKVTQEVSCYVASLQFCSMPCHVKEHGSMRVSVTQQARQGKQAGSRTSGRGFPKLRCSSHKTL